MRVLVCLDGSRWIFSVLEHLSQMLGPEDEVVLLAASPRDGAAYQECGRMILEAGEQACARIAPNVRVRTRLAVGDLLNAAMETAVVEGADLLILGARGRQGMPYGASLDAATRAIWAGLGRPILLGSPRGIELLAGEEALLVAARHGSGRRASHALTETGHPLDRACEDAPCPCCAEVR